MMISTIRVLAMLFLATCAAASLVKLSVNSGISNSVYHADTEPGKYALSKSWDNDPETFYHCWGTEGWGKYNIPESNVKRVRLQNRESYGHRMTGNVVYVCVDESDSSCQECGRVIGTISDGAWAQFDCSIRGTVVKVAATHSMLQIAEIEIFSDGTTTPAPTTTTPIANIVEENARGVGGWGGSCTCPDGQVYQVGDKDNGCRSLACYGGTPGHCSRNDGPWSRRKVVCGRASGNLVEENSPGIGKSGGSCTCPDGHVYQVGDKNDGCKSLACYGGTPGYCNRGGGPWSKRMVVCGQAPGNNVEENAKQTKGMGGSCTCPDGQVYQVRDGDDSCRSLSCYGGTPGICHRGDGPWSGRKVTCAAA